MSDTGRINVASESTDMRQKRSLDAHKWERGRDKLVNVNLPELVEPCSDAAL